MADKKETMAFLQAVLDNLEECDKKLSSIEDVIQKKRLIFLHQVPTKLN